MNKKKITTLILVTSLVATSIQPKIVHASENGVSKLTETMEGKNIVEANLTRNSEEVKKAKLDNWDYRETDSLITLTRYTGTEKDIVIEAEMNGKQVIVTRDTLATLPMNITSISINEINGKKLKIQGSNLSAVFKDKKQLDTVDLQGLDVSNVVDMGAVFSGSSAKTINLKGWNTSNVTNMYAMFMDCKNLTTLNLDSFDTSKVETMSFMFNNCSSLENLNVSNWNTSKVTTMALMFAGTTQLRNLNVSNWDTSKVKNMENMFNGASNLHTIDVSNWDTSKVTSMYAMFKNAEQISSLDVSNWITSSVTNMTTMFAGATQLRNLNVSNWDTSKVKNMENMFNGASNLRTIDVSNWDTSKVTSMYAMFKDVKQISTLNVGNWNTSSVTNMATMFAGTTQLRNLNVSNWDTSKVTSMYAMFKDAEQISSLDVSNWNTSNVTNMSYLFFRAEKLTNLDVSKWDTSKVIEMFALFNGALSLNNIDVSKWNTSNVTNMSYMFANAVKLNYFDLSSFNLQKVTKMDNMFKIDEIIMAEQPILIISKDEKLKRYNYSVDRRIPIGPTFDANYGMFSDGKTEQTHSQGYVIEDKLDSTINAIIENIKNDVEQPNRIGYTFAGWNEKKRKNISMMNNQQSDIYKKLNTRFYANWIINRYDVVFDSQKGSIVNSKNIQFDDLIQEPEAPTRTGYTFAGWYKEADCKNAWVFTTDKMPAKNVTLYAKWILNASEFNSIPTISATDKVLTVGDIFNPLVGVTAHDKEDGDIILTESNIIANNVNMSKKGKYTVTYKVIDRKGASTVKTITVTVNEKVAKPVENPENTPTEKPSQDVNNNIPTFKPDKLPQTGDVSNLGLLGLMLVGSGGMLLGLNRKKRKK